MNWVLLRGLAREARAWGDFPDKLKNLSKSEQVLCLDLPGFGSERDRRPPLTLSRNVLDLRKRFQTLRVSKEPFALLGISLGGMVALEWLRLFPRDFSFGIVMSSSAAASALPWQRLKPKALLQLIQIVTSRNPYQQEERVLKMTTNQAWADTTLVETWGRFAAESPPQLSHLLAQMASALLFRGPTSRLQIPVLFLGSLADQMVDGQCTLNLARITQAAVEMHDSAGHELALDDPQWVLDRIQAFATQLENRHER